MGIVEQAKKIYGVSIENSFDAAMSQLGLHEENFGLRKASMKEDFTIFDNSARKRNSINSRVETNCQFNLVVDDTRFMSIFAINVNYPSNALCRIIAKDKTVNVVLDKFHNEINIDVHQDIEYTLSFENVTAPFDFSIDALIIEPESKMIHR